MNHRERMLAGLPYKSGLDGLREARMENKLKVHAYNLLPPDEKLKLEELIRSILGKAGKGVHIEQPFHLYHSGCGKGCHWQQCHACPQCGNLHGWASNPSGIQKFRV